VLLLQWCLASESILWNAIRAVNKGPFKIGKLDFLRPRFRAPLTESGNRRPPLVKRGPSTKANIASPPLLGSPGAARNREATRVVFSEPLPAWKAIVGTPASWARTHDRMPGRCGGIRKRRLEIGTVPQTAATPPQFLGRSGEGGRRWRTSHAGSAQGERAARMWGEVDSVA